MDTIDITKMTPLRRLTRDYTSKEIEQGIKHLTKLKEEKEQEELKLATSIKEREIARKEAVESFKQVGIPVPVELTKEITIESELRKKRNQRRRKAVQNTTKAITEG